MKLKLLLVLSTIPMLAYTQDTLKKYTTKEIQIKSRGNGVDINEIKSIRTEKLTSIELRKNACCNLAESFESNPTVDVSFPDAATGALQIQMLGLSGIYVQTMTDLLPTVRGLNQTYGIQNIPGPFVDAIYINKGTGSVVNGHESITGQIDVELMKPEKVNRLYLNLYVNNNRRMEMNVLATKKFSPRLYSMLMVNGNKMNHPQDINNDYFIDMPLTKQINVINRWKYFLSEHIEGMAGVKAVVDEKKAGTYEHDGVHIHVPYNINIDNNHFELFTKNSYNFNDSKNKSIGMQLSGSLHQTSIVTSTRAYIAQQNSLFSNLIYQQDVNAKDIFKTGISNQLDYFHEQTASLGVADFQRRENVSGVYAEYAHTGEIFSWLIGQRVDYASINKLAGTGTTGTHRLYYTPRANLKINLGEEASLRLAAGTGFRQASVFAENTSLLISNKQWVMAANLLPEQATNWGINFSQHFDEAHNGRYSVEFFRTDFINQTIIDVDYNPAYVYVYNLAGKSYANSFQAELYYDLLENLQLRFAYKHYETYITYKHGQLERPLTPRDRALGNVAYKFLDEKIKVDFTTQYIGRQRLPDYSQNPEIYRLPAYSPSYFRLLGQVTYVANDKLEIYAGSENINNFRQQQPIIDAEHPFSPFFDSSVVWGPISQRTIYAGLRYSLK